MTLVKAKHKNSDKNFSSNSLYAPPLPPPQLTNECGQARQYDIYHVQELANQTLVFPTWKALPQKGLRHC